MPSATETQTEREVVTFIAQSPNQIVTRIPEDHVYNERGRKTGEYNRKSELKRLQAEKARGVEVSDEEIAEVDAPWKLEFGKDDGPHRLTTDNPVIIEFLRNHENFGVQGPSGFWELEAEPKPTLTEQTVRLNKASALGDVDEIEAVLALEKETHNRESIIQGAESALTALRELEAGASAGDITHQTGAPPSTSQN